MQMEHPFAQWSPPGRAPARDAALKVMDGVWAPQPSQPPGSHCLLEDLGDWILTRASERCYSGADLPSFRCSRETVHGMSSCCSTCGSVSMAECTHGDTGFAFSISPPTSELLIDEASGCQGMFPCMPPKNPWSEMDKFMIIASECYQQKLIFKSLFMKWILFGAERKPTYSCHDLNPSTRIMSTLRAAIAGKLLSKKRKEYSTDDLEEKLGLCSHRRNLNSLRKEDLHRQQNPYQVSSNNCNIPRKETWVARCPLVIDSTANVATMRWMKGIVREASSY